MQYLRYASNAILPDLSTGGEVEMGRFDGMGGTLQIESEGVILKGTI